MMLSKFVLKQSTTGSRYFSRADIMKGLDRSKISRRVFAKKELTENPEFFKAFPTAQTILNDKDEKKSSLKQETDFN